MSHIGLDNTFRRCAIAIMYMGSKFRISHSESVSIDLNPALILHLGSNIGCHDRTLT